MLRAALLIAILAAPALPALACSPASMEVTGKVQLVGECGQFWAIDTITGAGLSDAEPLEGGFALQETVSGNACYSTLSMVISDCTTGMALVLGPESFDLMGGKTGQGMDALRAKAGELAAQKALSLDAMEAEGRALGLTGISRQPLVAPLVLEGKTFALDCGCRVLFPPEGGKG
jgi:hypothetical protein